MGRGRQKAKQTKVARELKYYSPETNYSALELELRGESHHDDAASDHIYDAYEVDDDDNLDELVDKYADWIEDLDSHRDDTEGTAGVKVSA